MFFASLTTSRYESISRNCCWDVDTELLFQEVDNRITYVGACSIAESIRLGFSRLDTLVLYSCFSLLTRKTTASATTVSRSFRQPSVARTPIRVRRCARSTFPVRLVLPVDRRQRHHVDGRHLHQQAHSPHRRHCLRSV